MSFTITTEHKKLMDGYLEEALSAIIDEQEAKDRLNDIVGAIEEKTGIPKAEAKKWYKAINKGNKQELLDKAHLLIAINEIGA